MMTIPLIWDENKRQSNLIKHGLDFADAYQVLDNPYRYDVDSARDEMRTQTFAYVFGQLNVLTVVHTPRDHAIRIISFRKASSKERLHYYEWLEKQFPHES